MGAALQLTDAAIQLVCTAPQLVPVSSQQLGAALRGEVPPSVDARWLRGSALQLIGTDPIIRIPPLGRYTPPYC